KEKQTKQLEAKKLEQLHKENLARMMSEASGGGSPSARGNAAKSMGLSDSYQGRIRARVKPNIVFADDVPGNPSAEVGVGVAPEGLAHAVINEGASFAALRGISPSELESLYAEAHDLLVQERWSEALDDLALLVSLEPSERRYVFAFAWCLHRLGSYEDAGTQY